jgi:hypothetical protein
MICAYLLAEQALDKPPHAFRQGPLLRLSGLGLVRPTQFFHQRAKTGISPRIVESIEK